MDQIENRFFDRVDQAGRNVRITFVKKNGELFWIRVCTFFSKEVKLRSDYYREFSSEEFERIYRKEYPNMPDEMKVWVMCNTRQDNRRLGATAQILSEGRKE